MGSVDRVDDRTFKVNFSGDGVAKLREKVGDKLKEFMGDYTDDTLVEYVIVLLRNGRRKEEAKNELNVFLGDNSDSFVSWLWVHLASNLDLYVQSKEAHIDETAKEKFNVGNQSEKYESRHRDSESEKGKSDNWSRSRQKREWKGLARDANEPPLLCSSQVESVDMEEKTHRKVSRTKRSVSPRHPLHKRSRHDEREHMKRESVSQATIDAPRRILQFAVRDAVGTSRPSGSDRLIKEPSLKRLRSVVSTSTEESSLVDPPRRIQSVARVPNPMATVIKAVQEAAEDVIKVKSAGSVFDRLGRGADLPERTEQFAEFRDVAIEDERYEGVNQMQEQTRSNHLQRRDYSGRVGNIYMESETGLQFDSMSDDEGYDDINIMGDGVMGVSQTDASGSKSADDVMPISRLREQNQPVSANVNTWKSPRYQELRGLAEIDSQKSVQGYERDAGKSAEALMKENGNPVAVGNGNAKPVAHMQKESQKTSSLVPGSYTASRPLEDPDARTIFVSNVHFAASKDSLSRHFNKFGEVLKVIVVTDVATGQPKGSAYVEFMRKEAADNALSLDGTSFMSRILKVVKRSSAPQETTPTMTWPRIARGSPYGATRFARGAFARGIPGAYRPRLPMKPGARSLQWKRDAQGTPSESGAQASGSGVSPAARSLTYVRTEPKPDGSLGTS